VGTLIFKQNFIFFLIFGVRVGPSLGLGLREKNEENKGALSPLFSSFFHLELGGESKGEVESVDLRELGGESKGELGRVSKEELGGENKGNHLPKVSSFKS
jgi:hypothetical protein